MSLETAVANDTGPWREKLTGAFEILLGGPLSAHDPDAVYATYFGGGLISEIGFSRDTAWLDPAALIGAAPVVWDYPPFDQGEPPLQFDAAGSVFELSQDGLPADVAADLTRACFAPSLVRGADLAPVLARHSFDLAAHGQWEVCYPRIASDGTLFDAMRVATGLGESRESLLPCEAQAAEEWEDALAAIPDPDLVAHLSFFCTDGDEGLMYLRDQRSGGPILADEGCTLIANWEEGQSQVEFAVVRLSPHVAGSS